MDWIDQFISQTSSIRSPESFRLWAAIATIAMAMERKVWTVTDVDKLYPNLYVTLVGLPASGKTNAVKEARKLLASVPDVRLSPDDVTKASFQDALALSTKRLLNGGGGPMYSSLAVLCLEFGVFIPKYEEGFCAQLATLYDNPPIYNAPRRVHGGVNIESPGVNILAAATHAAIGNLPEVAWGEGLTSRIIFVHGVAPTTRRKMFVPRVDPDMNQLKAQLLEIYNEHHGEFEWEAEAQDAYDVWYNDEKMAPIPTYGRLVNYNGRRSEQVTKLSMISAVSANHGMTVTLSDFLRGRKWLLDAEIEMPDVFRGITQRSDAQTLQDLHHWMYQTYSRVARDKRKDIPESDLWAFLESRATSDKIPGLILAAEKTNRMRRGLFPKTWIPNELNAVAPDATAFGSGEFGATKQ